MATIQSIADAQKSLSAQLMDRMANFEKQLEGKAGHSGDSVSHLSAEFYNFKQQVWDILSLLQLQVEEIVKSYDILETRHRNKYLLLSGVPEKPDEDISKKILSIFHDKLGISNISSSSIKTIIRLGKISENKCRSILVKFSDLNIKKTIWSKKASLKGSSYVLSEYLTKYRQTLFLSARRHLGMRNVCTNNGQIVLKLPSGDFKKVHNQQDLGAILAEVPNVGFGSDKAPSIVTTLASKAEPSRVKRLTHKKK